MAIHNKFNIHFYALYMSYCPQSTKSVFVCRQQNTRVQISTNKKKNYRIDFYVQECIWWMHHMWIISLSKQERKIKRTTQRLFFDSLVSNGKFSLYDFIFFLHFTHYERSFVFDKWSFLCVGTMNCNSFRLLACVGLLLSILSFSFSTPYFFIRTVFAVLFCVLCSSMRLFSSIPSSAYNSYSLFIYPFSRCSLFFVTGAIFSRDVLH